MGVATLVRLFCKKLSTPQMTQVDNINLITQMLALLILLLWYSPLAYGVVHCT